MALVKPDQQITHAISAVDGVVSIFVRDQGDLVRVITIVEEDTDEVCEAIYAIERGLIRRFPASRFDFNIVAQNGRQPSAIFGDTAPSWQRHDWCQIEHCI